MRISDWSSDVCSSDLHDDALDARDKVHRAAHAFDHLARHGPVREIAVARDLHRAEDRKIDMTAADHRETVSRREEARRRQCGDRLLRSEEHTSELQSLMRISSDVFCLKTKQTHTNIQNTQKIY